MDADVGAPLPPRKRELKTQKKVTWELINRNVGAPLPPRKRELKTQKKVTWELINRKTGSSKTRGSESFWMAARGGCSNRETGVLFWSCFPNVQAQGICQKISDHTEPGLVEVRDTLNSGTTPCRQMRLLIEIVP